MLCRRIAMTVLLALAAAAQGTAAEEITVRQRLAMQFARSAALNVDSDTLTVGAITTGCILIREAVALDPDNPELWRLAWKFAQLAEDDDLYAESLRNVIRLDPRDDVAQLLRLTLAVEQYHSVEERIAAYERMLGREELGAAVRSRLALDLALLQQRHGDLEAFAEAVSLAVELDPSNRSAAAIAAGFFRMNVDEPFAEAELLFNLLVSDPTDVTTPIALASLLLEHGAYVGAARLYDLATRSLAAVRMAPSGSLLADQSIAQWAGGDPAAALRTIRLRQGFVDRARQNQEWQENPDLDPLERAEFHGVINPTLATVRAAIHAQRGDEEKAASAAAALEAYQTLVERALAADPPPDPADIARFHLERAWVAAWLGDDVRQVEDSLASAERYRTLSDPARARFDGWLALRRGDPAGAIQRLSPLAETDPAAGIGLAEAYLRVGQRRDAARALLAAARMQPGSLIGVWASNELADLLGQRLALTEEAQRLEELIRSMPRFLDRFPESPTVAVDLTVEPAKAVFQAYEPLIITVEITNVSPYPLAIDREGPIRPYLILELTTTLTREATPAGGLVPVVVDIDRRLRLEPRESVVIPIDLRRYALGWALNTSAVRGTFVRVKVGVNSVMTPRGSLEPGLLGSEQWTGQIRVEGVRAGRDWLRAIVREFQETGQAEDLVTLAFLGNLVVVDLPRYLQRLETQQIQLEAATDPEAERQLDRVNVQIAELRTLLPDAADVLVAAFSKLDGVRQAWLLGIMPNRQLHEKIRAMAMRSDERLVRMSYLLFHVSGADDPVLDAALRSDDEHLRQMAQEYKDVFQRIAEQERMPASPVPPAGSTGPG